MNTRQENDYGYICFYNGKQVEVYAPSMHAAKQLAVKHFHPPKSKEHMISVCLCERADGAVVETVI